MKNRDDLDPLIAKKLEKLDEIPQRNSRRAAEGKTAFLKAAGSLKESVSPEDIRRHKNWKEQPSTNSVFRRKEYKPMFSTITAIILAISLLLGGSGATVAAAQASLPGDFLYDVKLLSEDALMGLTANPEDQLDLALNLVDRRAEEIQSLLDSGEIITDETQTQYRDQIEEAIMLSLSLPEDQVVQALEKVQTRLQTEEQTLLQTRTNGSESAIMALTQVRDTIQERLQIIENGQLNLLQIQEQLQNQQQLNNPDQKSTNAPTEAGSELAPGTGDGNPWTEGTPTPGSSYGPGESNNPFAEGTPTPGSAYGPGGNNMDSTDTISVEENSINGSGAGVSNGSGSSSGSVYHTLTPTRTPKAAGGSGTGSQSSGGNR